MKKYRSKLTDHEQKELTRLSKLDLSKWNEQTIREEFIKKLLDILGYRKDLDYSLDYNESVELDPRLAVLFKRICPKSSISKLKRPDYAGLIRKQYFWVIEAKTAKTSDSKRQIQDDDVIQAYFYSLLPSMNCKYFIVCNGWCTNLYDRDGLDESLRPLLSIKQSEIVERFFELDSYIGSTQLLPLLKTNILVQIKKVLSSEIFIDRLDEFKYEADGAVASTRSKVYQNLRDYIKKEKGRSDNTFAADLQHARLDNLAFSTFLGARTVGEISRYSNVVIEKIRNEKSHALQSLFLGKLFLEDVLTPVTFRFFCNVLCFLLKLDEAALPDVRYNGKNVRQLLDEWVELIIFHFGRRPELRLLWAFEGLLFRITERESLLPRSHRSVIKETSEFLRFYLTEEELSLSSFSEANLLTLLIESNVLRGLDYIIVRYYDENKRVFSTLAYEEYNSVCTFTDFLERDTETIYRDVKRGLGSSWFSVFDYAHMNNSFDFLGSMACEYLKKFPSYVKTLDGAVQGRLQILAETGYTNYAKDVCNMMGIAISAEKKEPSVEKMREFFDPRKNPYKFKL